MSKLFNSKKFEEFKEFQQFVRDIPNINFGGCGVAALAFYRKLKELGYRNVKIVYGYDLIWSRTSYKRNSEAIKTNDISKASACSHAFIRINNRYLDCRGEISPTRFDEHHELPIKIALESVRNAGWNRTFNRKKYLKQIEKKLGYKIL